MNSHFGRSHWIFSGRGERDRVIFISVAGLALTLVIVLVMVVNFRADSASATQDKLLAPTTQMPVNVGAITLFAPERPVRAGTRLSEVKFKEVYWPRNQVPDEAVRDLAEVKSLYAKADLPAGVPMQRMNLTQEPLMTILPLTEGNRAVSIEVDETSGLEGHALPGTRVDVVLTYHEGGELTSKILVQNARVLSYGGDLTPGNKRSYVGPSRTSKTITLDVATEDALKIQTARQLGRLSLMMRASDDDKSASVMEVNRPDIEGKDKTKVRAQPGAGCTRGKMRVGGQEFMMNCDGTISQLMRD